MFAVVLTVIAVALADSSSSDSGPSYEGDAIHHNPAKFVKEWKMYEELSSSSIAPLRNEPAYTARVLQPQTKKWFKTHMNSTKAYCDGNGKVADRCKAIMCYATSSLLQGQFAEHFSQSDVCPKKPNAASLKISKEDLKKNPELAYLKPINPVGVLVMLKDQASKAQSLCHKTKHTTDDRCKDLVHCLTLGALTSAWPDLFEIRSCRAQDLVERDPHATKLKLVDPTDYEDYSRLAGIKVDPKTGLIDPADVPFKPKDVEGWAKSSSSSSSSSDSK